MSVPLAYTDRPLQCESLRSPKIDIPKLCMERRRPCDPCLFEVSSLVLVALKKMGRTLEKMVQVCFQKLQVQYMSVAKRIQ